MVFLQELHQNPWTKDVEGEIEAMPVVDLGAWSIAAQELQMLSIVGKSPFQSIGAIVSFKIVVIRAFVRIESALRFAVLFELEFRAFRMEPVFVFLFQYCVPEVVWKENIISAAPDF